MNSDGKYRLNIRIDSLTNSIRNIVSGDSFPTEVNVATKSDLKIAVKMNDWKFDWTAEHKTDDRRVFKLTIKHNPTVLQGLASISEFPDHVYIHLVESAPFNQGKNKMYEGVPGNIFAFACKLSSDRGNEGIVSFQSKTLLIEHYEKTLGATHIGGNLMIIFPGAAKRLIQKYF
jgi:hypothetical protein